MGAEEAYETLSKYQLIDGENRSIGRVFEIQAKYEKFRSYLDRPNSSPLVKRIRDVLDACKTIENAIQA